MGGQDSITKSAPGYDALCEQTRTSTLTIDIGRLSGEMRDTHPLALLDAFVHALFFL